MERNFEPKQQFGLPDIGIPFEILFHPKLTNTEKILYGFIRNLAQSEKGCYASNGWLAGLMGVGTQTISNAIANLKEWEIIIIEDQDNKRLIYINNDYKKLYNKFTTEKGYKKINRGVLKNLYPSIKNFIGSYSLTYSKSILKDVSKIDHIKIILENLPEEWRTDKNLLRALEDWLMVRKEKKSSPTKRACELAGKDLSKYSLETSVRALDAAAKNGYTGVFPEKHGKPINQAHQKQSHLQLTPMDIFQKKINSSYAKRFNEYFLRARKILTEQTDNNLLQLAENMLVLRQHIKNGQSEQALKDMSIPSAGGIIDLYTMWLEEQDWIDEINPATYTAESRLYQKFKHQYSQELGVDIMKGNLV